MKREQHASGELTASRKLTLLIKREMAIRLLTGTPVGARLLGAVPMQAGRDRCVRDSGNGREPAMDKRMVTKPDQSRTCLA